MSKLFVLACATLCVLTSVVHSADFYVSPGAAAGGAGDRNSPFPSLVEARDHIRELNAMQQIDGDATIWLADGHYELTETFILGIEDGGRGDNLVTWRAEIDADVTFTSTAETIVAIYDARNLVLSDIIFVDANQQAVEVAHCANVTIENCRIVQSKHTGVHLFGGKACRVLRTHFDSCAQSGIRIEGGDRHSLTPAQHSVFECTLINCGYGGLSQSAAIHVVGVGNLVTNTTVMDCESTGVRLDGNDHDIAGNRLLRTCLNTENNGAIYLGQDWSERGNVIEANFIQDVGEQPRLDLIAIYLDDLASGTNVLGNIVMNAGRGIAIAGGESNVVQRNILHNCRIGIQLDNRSERWASDGMLDELRQPLVSLESVWHRYAEKYPELPDSLHAAAFSARDNVFEENILQQSGSIAFDSRESIALNRVKGNLLGDRLVTLDCDRSYPQVIWTSVVSDYLIKQFAKRNFVDIPVGSMISTDL